MILSDAKAISPDNILSNLKDDYGSKISIGLFFNVVKNKI